MPADFVAFPHDVPFIIITLQSASAPTSSALSSYQGPAPLPAPFQLFTDRGDRSSRLLAIAVSGHCLLTSLFHPAFTSLIGLHGLTRTSTLLTSLKGTLSAKVFKLSKPVPSITLAFYFSNCSKIGCESFANWGFVPK